MKPSARSDVIRAIVVGAVAIVALGAALVAVFLGSGPPEDPPPLAAPVDPRLPDLTIAPLTDITGGLNEDGSQSVRFGVMIVNEGQGDFLLRARRPNALSDDWRVTQRIADVGGYTEKDSDATLVFAGDGHDHWHIREVESHTIEDMEGRVLGQVVKAGFCFFDTNQVRSDLPGASPAKVYGSTDCGGRFDSAIRMGLSVGWGDEYPWHLFQQEIDISDLAPGPYRLRAVVDPFGWFDELVETNNEVTHDIVLRFDGDVPVVDVVTAGR